jgi:hypothetical protein
MSTWINQRKWLALLGAVGLIVLSLLAIARITQAEPRPIFYLPPRGETMLYLAAYPKTAVDLQASVADLNLNGVTVVYEFNELQNRVAADANAIDAVIIHITRLKDVDQVWIKNLYQQGVVIAGVNITIRELGRFIGDDYVANDSTWTDGWQKEPFFSILAFKPTGTSEEQQRALTEGRLLGQAMRSTDNIRNSNEVDVFLSLIRRDIWELQGVETSSTTK